MRGELPDSFVSAAHAALPVLGADALGQVGYDITQGLSPDAIVGEFHDPASVAPAQPLAEIMQGGVGWDAAGSYLMGLADGYRAARA